MFNRRSSVECKDAQHDGKVYRKKNLDVYECSTYKLAGVHFLQACSSHYIRTDAVNELVLDAIRQISKYVKTNETEFIERIRAESAIRHTAKAKASKRQFTQNECRIDELDTLFQKVYEDNASGKLSDERFKQLSGVYEKEQAELREQNTILQNELEAFEADSDNVSRFLELIKRYTTFDEISTPMLNEFIQKILVHAPDRTSGFRVVKVDIWFNFIGNFELPKEEHTPEEIEAETKYLQKCLKQRESNRRYREKKRAKELLEQALATAA
jgi:hypothetical protein